MVPYSKPAKSPADLVQQLKQRGLAIADEARAERYIDNIGYYRLSAYMYPFLAEPKTAHQYKPGITFDPQFSEFLLSAVFGNIKPTNRLLQTVWTGETAVKHFFLVWHGSIRVDKPVI